MALVNVKEEVTTQGADAESQDGQTGQRGSVRTFTVLVDDPVNDSTENVQLMTGVPRVRDPHPLDTYKRCRAISVERVSLLMFRVRCTYGANYFKPGESPLSQPARYLWGSEKSDEPVDQDANLAPICTACGELFDPPITRRFSTRTLTVSRNQADYNDFFYSDFENTVNSGPFGLWPRGTVFCDSITGESVSDEDYTYWLVTFRFLFRRGVRTTDERAWWKRVRHEGFYEWQDDGTGNPDFNPFGDPIINPALIKGEPAVTPVLLKANGLRETDPAAAVWLEFQMYPYADFSLLSI